MGRGSIRNWWIDDRRVMLRQLCEGSSMVEWIETRGNRTPIKNRLMFMGGLCLACGLFVPLAIANAGDSPSVDLVDTGESTGEILDTGMEEDSADTGVDVLINNDSSGEDTSVAIDTSDTSASNGNLDDTSTTLEDSAEPSDTGPDKDPCMPLNIQAPVVINEFLPNPAGTDGGFEWVELYLGGTNSIDVSGWSIEAGTSSYATQAVFPEGTVLDPGNFLWIGGMNVAGADVMVDGFYLPNASGSSDSVRLLDCEGAIVDTVVYGEPNEDGWLDDTLAVAESMAPSPSNGKSLGRVEDGVDTDASALDFVAYDPPSPATSNTIVPVVELCGGPGSGLVINEFLADAPSSDAGFEWVELYHSGSETLDLTGWALQTATSGFSLAYTFKGGAQIAPGEFLVVGGSEVPEADIVAPGLSLGNAGSSGDGIRIVDCLDFPADTVIYGGNNDDGFINDDGELATSFAPMPPSEQSAQRIEDGYDTNASGNDFVVTKAPTPGASNPVIEPPVCETSKGQVLLNEFLPDPTSTDDGAEWIELYNGSDVDIRLDGWWISAGTKDFDSITFTFPTDTFISGGDWFVVGGEWVEEADLVLDFSLGNGSGGDGLRLFDCNGLRVDTVVYGDENEVAIPDDKGIVGAPSPKPDTQQSLGRTVDGVDDDLADDWTIQGAATPGAANEAPEITIVPEPEPTGCMGQGQAPGGQAPSGCGASNVPSGNLGGGGCNTIPLPLKGMELFLGALVCIRRRYRRHIDSRQ